MTGSLSPVALSRLTWSADDRQAWNETYRVSLLVAVRRDGRRAAVDVHPAYQGLSTAARRVIAEDARYSVHVDVMTGA